MTTFLTACRTATLLGMLAPFAVAMHGQVTPPMPPMAPLAPLPPEPHMVQSVYFSGSGFANRGYLGITPRNSSGPADTLGLLVDEVESGLAADKAGIKRGSRLVSIDDVSLRVDPRDLGDYAGEALPENRLRRVLSRKAPGDTVAIVVLTDGRKDTRRVVLSESPLASTFRAMTTARRVLGVSFAQRGSSRDTAGLLIVSVSSGGAADKAGLNEGDRVVSVDGVDLRVSAADAGTSEGVTARVSRFRRALDAARDSQPVKLDVLSDGRRRTVSVVPTRERGFVFSTGGLDGMAASIRGAISRDFNREFSRDFDQDNDRNDNRNEAVRERAEARAEGLLERADAQREMAREQREMAREMAREQRDLARERRDSDDNRGDTWSRSGGEAAARGTMHGRTDGATLAMGGLSLASVDRDFAQRFGQGSENGALVVRVRGDWDPLKPGDVLLTIEGRSVRDGNSLDVTIDRRRDQRLEVLRNGKKETLTLPAAR